MDATLHADLRLLSHRICDDTRDQVIDYAASPAIQRMVRAQMDTDGYRALLAQLVPVYEALDRAIVAHRDDVAPLREAVPDYLLLGVRGRRDLEALVGAGELTKAGAAAGTLLDAIDHAAADEPLRLFGQHYARQGLIGIHRYAADRLRRGPAGGSVPTEMLDPYRRGSSAMWARFNRDTDKFRGDETARSAIVEAARGFLVGLAALSMEVAGGEPVPEADRVSVPSSF